ncbi:MAG: hypothetical protein HUU34_01055 [Saprospiraceae bacterium]|nr:hypothetical protein [Saprospiraceae bacterium]
MSIGSHWRQQHKEQGVEKRCEALREQAAAHGQVGGFLKIMPVVGVIWLVWRQVWVVWPAVERQVEQYQENKTGDEKEDFHDIEFYLVIVSGDADKMLAPTNDSIHAISRKSTMFP